MLTIEDGPLLQIFAAVVRLGSFSAAAADARVSKSVVSERIAQLEARCGARLLERTTRRLRLTDVGREVLEAALRLDETLRQLTLTLEEQLGEPSGTLRIASTHDLGPLLLAPAAARFVRAYPKVRLELVSDDVRQDLLEEQLDVAVRLGVPTSTSFIMRKLAVLSEPIVAAPGLAETLGTPVRPLALQGAPWVSHALFVGRALTFMGPGEQVEEVAPQVRVQADSGATLLSLLLQGAGVGVLPEHALYDHLREGRLVQLCPGWIWKRVSLFTLVPSRAYQRPVVKAFLATLADQVAMEPGRWGQRLQGGRQDSGS